VKNLTDPDFGEQMAQSCDNPVNDSHHGFKFRTGVKWLP
jgi:hypothetical protein